MKTKPLNLKPIDWSLYAQMDWEQLRQDIRDEYGNKALHTTYNDKRVYGRRIKFRNHPDVNINEIIGFIKGKGYKAEQHSSNHKHQSQGYVLVYLGTPGCPNLYPEIHK